MEFVVLSDDAEKFLKGEVIEISEIRNVKGCSEPTFKFHFEVDQLVQVKVSKMNLIRSAKIVESTLVPEIKSRFGAMAAKDDGVYNLKIRIIE